MLYVVGAALAALCLFCRPHVAFAATDGYPYGSKPCIWAPYAASGSGAGWCADYDFGDRPNDTSPANVLSPYGYYYRNCTDYTAWKVSSRGVGPEQYRGLGNAKDWAERALAHGLVVDGTPAVGAVGVSSSGQYGHTAFVEAVHPEGYPPDTIEVSQYNYAGDGNYSNVFGTPAAFGLTRFIHFEAYEPSPAPAPPAEALPAPSLPAELPATTLQTESITVDAPPQNEPATFEPVASEQQAAAITLASTIPEDAPAETAEPPPEEPPPEADAQDAPDKPAKPRWWRQATTSPPMQATTVAALLTPQTTKTPNTPHAHNANPAFASWPLVGLTATVLCNESLSRRSAARRH